MNFEFSLGLLTLYLNLLVTLDNIADSDVVERLDVKTAILSYNNLLHVILESLERAELTCVDYDTVADYAWYITWLPSARRCSSASRMRVLLPSSEEERSRKDWYSV